MNHIIASEYFEPLSLAADQDPNSVAEAVVSQSAISESSFYNQYEWCLNPFLALASVILHLQEEVYRFLKSKPGWQRDETCTNIYLLACAILDSTDDYLLVRKYDFSKLAGAPVLGRAVSLTEQFYNRGGRLLHDSRGLADWRERWQAELVRALKLFLVPSASDNSQTVKVLSRLSALLATKHLRVLLDKRVRIPGAFRSQDLTHFDVLALGQKFISSFPERKQPTTVMGLRTAGSYFAPMLHAYLSLNDYTDVESLTIRPKHGCSKREISALNRCVSKRGTLVIIDEPIGSGSTLSKAAQIACRYSIPRDKVVILTPIHPSARNWKDGSGYQMLSDLRILTLEPEEWHKWSRLDAETGKLVSGYFQSRGVSVHSVTGHSTRADKFNEQLEQVSEQKGHTRLKRVYEVLVSSDSGSRDSRYVLAKSVGWGWLSYHAFLAAERLSAFVPTLLGLRNGILYTEWHPTNGFKFSPLDRKRWIDQAASYIATRTQKLPLDADPASDLIVENRNNGLASLARNLCRAYGARPAPFLKWGRVCHELTKIPCPRPTLIDGKLRPAEWVHPGGAALKCDFEQHGLGKTEINMTDPAYDLAESVLTWKLSFDEENELLRRYIQDSQDVTVTDRLFVNKLAAGVRALDAALANLNDPHLTHRSQEFNRDYIEAWNFLVLHTMRYCAGLCFKSDNVQWRAPLVVMDVDGVLDKQVIGFPSTTWAGMQAVSLLHSHNFPVVLNTARSIPEVKEYSRHYGFLGGIAEYGAFVWDGTTNTERILITQESLSQLYTLAEKLRRIPGVFLNDDYLYSIRAYTFEGGATRAIPGLLIQNLISQLKLDRLHFHQTYTDTAVVAKETDKGKGLLSFLELAGQTNVPTLAIGDSGADLPMFKVATNGFAPGHVSCRNEAKTIGCYVDALPFQPGLLNIVRRIIHPDKSNCQWCRSAELPQPGRSNVVLRVLKHADESQLKRMLRAMFDPMVARSFLAN